MKDCMSRHCFSRKDWDRFTRAVRTLITSQPLSQTLITLEEMPEDKLEMLKEMLEMLEEMLVRCDIIKAARDTSRRTDFFLAAKVSTM